MTPDEYEDIAYECNRELGQAEQREIDRRVAYALGEQDAEAAHYRLMRALENR